LPRSDAAGHTHGRQNIFMNKKDKPMARPSTLNKLVDLAQQKTDAAAKNLALLNVSTLEAEHKLRLLLTYRDDYYTRFQQAAGNGIDQAAWRNFHAFMAKLDAAIAEQRGAVTDSKRGVQTGQREWQAEQQRCNGRSSHEIVSCHRGTSFRGLPDQLVTSPGCSRLR